MSRLHCISVLTARNQQQHIFERWGCWEPIASNVDDDDDGRNADKPTNVQTEAHVIVHFTSGQARVYRCRVGPRPHSGRVPRRAVRRPLPLYERYVRCSPGAVPFRPSFPAQEPTRMPTRTPGASSCTSDPQGRGTACHSNRTRNPKAKMHRVSESPYRLGCRGRARDLQPAPGVRQTVNCFCRATSI